MTSFFLFAIFIIAALSLLSYVYCWQDIKGGRPHIIMLRQITLIMDRNELNRLFGPPEPGFYYALTPEKLRGLLTWRRGFFLRECATDGICLIGAWHYMVSHSSRMEVALFIALALVCQGINLGYSAWLIHKWRAQISEELGNSED